MALIAKTLGLKTVYTLFKPLVPKKSMLCILCAVASCCTLPTKKMTWENTMAKHVQPSYIPISFFGHQQSPLHKIHEFRIPESFVPDIMDASVFYFVPAWLKSSRNCSGGWRGLVGGFSYYSKIFDKLYFIQTYRIYFTTIYIGKRSKAWRCKAPKHIYANLVCSIASSTGPLNSAPPAERPRVTRALWWGAPQAADPPTPDPEKLQPGWGELFGRNPGRS